MPRYTDSRYTVQRRAGFSWLSFSSDLENEYRERHPLLNPDRLLVAHVVALFLLFGFILLDWLIGPRALGVFETLILVCVTAPALAVPIVATNFLAPGPRMQRVVFYAGLALGWSVTLVTELGRAAQPWFPYEIVILALMYVYLVSGLLYFQAATVGISMLALFAVCELFLRAEPSDRFVYETYLLFVGNVLGLLGLYALQYDARRAFLMENELKQEAMLDSLTGLLNRREFNRHFETTWRQARRDKTTIGLLMVDVDNFKNINDTCGHLAGDAALLAIGQVLVASTMRPLDTVGRYGGDEFLAVWYGIDPDGFDALAANIASQVASIELPGVDRTKCRVSISGGAVLARPDQVLEPQDAVRLADRMLYEEKKSGGTIGVAVLTPDSKDS